jgi:hypothetical protein
MAVAEATSLFGEVPAAFHLPAMRPTAGLQSSGPDAPALLGSYDEESKYFLIMVLEISRGSE